MKLKRKKRSFADPNAALSDLAFLLIIYFIVISGFNINQGFLLNLPAKNSTRLLLKEDILRYELDNQGNIIFAGGTVTLKEAERDITRAVRQHPNIAVLLTVAAEAPWQCVVTFIELAEKLSISAFSFKIAET